MKSVNCKSVLFGVGVGCFFCTSAALGAPGKLSNNPLFLGSSVQPNILLLIDDSGSMDWEVLMTNGALNAHPSAPNGYNLDFTPNDNEERRELCYGYNAMAFNPSKIYSPWVGVDASGTSYTDRTLLTGLNNPYSGIVNTGNIIDLTNHYYYTYVDTNNDGVYQNGECSTANSNRVFVNTLTAVEQQNYANWYSYYRKREYVAKRAISEIINKSSARMGLATLHNNNSVGTIIQDVDNKTLPVNATAQANKQNLADNLFQIDSTGGTPLRQRLDWAGRYFKTGTNTSNNLFGFSPNPNSPIVSAAKGGECQQNFTVLMSDGYWNGDPPSSIGNTDRDGAGSFDGGSYADNVSDTLADVAMKYYETDLATGLADLVPTVQTSIGLDNNSAQHMVTYTVAFGIDGTLTANPTDPVASFNWPTPFANNPTTIDDMRHAAWNGRGLFLNAKDPDALVSSLLAAINDIDSRQGSASSVSFNTTSISSNTQVFQARFDTDGWSGSLSAFAFDTNGVGVLNWNAGTVLDQRDLVTNPREILTSSGVNTTTKGVPFVFPVDYTNPTSNEMSVAQIQDLLVNAPFPSNTSVAAEIAANQQYGQNLVAYLRGDNSNEGVAPGQFRPRLKQGASTVVHHRLGDIIHSSPQFVGAPATNYPDLIEGVGNEYSTFVKAKATRKPVIYIGANDGMLHAFNANTGAEEFAFIPNAMFSDQIGEGLHYLAEANYRHKPYVDGSPFSADVFISGSWATYLVGGYRAGGKGIYVLDVTNPSTISEASAGSRVKFEFTHNDLGYTFSRPLIGKMNNGKWAAVFGNGYNNDPLGDGRAKLFIVYLDGSGYKLLDTKQGSMVGSDCQAVGSDCNGLSSPTILDMTGDAIIDRAYAGDLFGNLWAFDLSSIDDNQWDSAYSASATVPSPLFQACSSAVCSSATRQPITVRPTVAVHPSRTNLTTEPNLMVYFGTGQYIAEGDNSNADQQTMYGIWDAGIGQMTRVNLQTQTVSNSATVTRGRDLTNNTVNYTVGSPTSQLGWLIDLPATRERVVVEPLTSGNLLFFNTNIPDDTPCSVGGSGYLMFVNRQTGGQPDFTVLDYNNNGTLDEDVISGYLIDALPGGSRIIDNIIVTSDSSGDILDFDIAVDFDRVPKRSSWSTGR
ncbi:MAG: pilus assembly protein PilY [Cellvibrionaceae bacterium]